MKKYAESSSLNNKVTRKDEDRDQDGLTIMILRPPKCETVSGQYWQTVKMMNVKLTNLAQRQMENVKPDRSGKMVNVQST